MNARYALITVVLVVLVVVAIVLLTPTKPKAPPGVASSPIPTPTAVEALEPSPIALPDLEISPVPDAPVASETVIPETAEPTPAIAVPPQPTPTLTREEAIQKVALILSQFEDAVTSKDEAHIEELIAQLAALGDAAVSHLANLVQNHPDENVREYIAHALVKLGTPSAVSVLLSAIHEEADPRLKNNLRSILATVNNPEIIPLAIDGLAQRDLEWWHEDALAILLRMESAEVAEALVRGYREQPGLTEAGEQRFLDGIAALQDAESVPYLSELLSDVNTEDTLRVAAAEGLAHVGSPEAVSHLLSQADDTLRVDLRAEFLDSVSGIANKNAVDVLLNRLQTGGAEDVRAAAAYALAMDENEPTLQLLISIYNSEASLEVKEAIAATLQVYGTRQM